MWPSKEETDTKETLNNHEERTQKIDSDIKTRKLQLVEELENSQTDDSRRRHPKFPLTKTNKPMTPKFAPFLAHTIEVPGNNGFYYGTNFYIEKYKMIIICPLGKTVYFYDSNTLLPLGGRQELQIDSPVLHISFCEETDVCLFACLYGNIYAYDLSNHVLTKLQKHGETLVPAVVFMNPSCYAFSVFKSNQLFIGNLDEGSLLSFDCNELDPSAIYRLQNEKILLSGFTDGSLRVYRTDRLPKLPVFCSEGSQKTGVMKIEMVTIHRKEYIITAENDGVIRIRHFLKGKVRLVKVIPAGEKVYWWIYLEKYNMIVTTHGGKDIKFWSLPSGKLKYTYSSDQAPSMNVFLMKDKDAIGVASKQKNIIEIVKLSGSEK